MISDLQQSDQGYHIKGCGIGAIFFADDICLISATNTGLRTLVEITEKLAVEQQVKLSPEKSKRIVCGPAKRLNPAIVAFGGDVVNQVKSLRYLGFELEVNNRGVLSVVVNCTLKKLYCSAKVIFSRYPDARNRW